MTRTRRPSHPGFVLMVNYKEPLHLTVTALADALNITPKHMSNLLHEKVPVTPRMALRLAYAFRTTPQMWLNLQSNYDLWKEAQDAAALAHVRCLVA